ncbi:MAG: ABC transporter ATP-binding protein [Candidatus Nezhaarchaeota archaeon]|nr:ABC transporter ATP-binding protein [Candidatus Nezhaarchaeota archaeon]
MRFGGLVALDNVDFYVGEQEIVGLIGPNGAGKTTLFNVIAGVYKPQNGAVMFRGRNIIGLKPHKICRLGIARTFQIVRVFPSLTVFENVKVAASNSPRHGKESINEEVVRLVDFVGLSGKISFPARELTLVEQKLVEVARALATRPQVLLLDEPLAGLTPAESAVYTDKMRRLRDEFGVSIFWIEHDVKSISRTCDRVIVLNHGKKIGEGECKEVLETEEVVRAYLGEKIA